MQIETNDLCILCNKKVYEKGDPNAPDPSLCSSFVFHHIDTDRQLEIHFCCAMDIIEYVVHLKLGTLN